MASNNLKTLKKLRKRYAWSGMITTIVMLILICLLLGIVVSATLEHSIDMWMSSEYDRIVYVSNLYSRGGSSMISDLQAEDTAFVVTDAQGNVLEEHGTNTCVIQGYNVSILDSEGVKDITVYFDRDNKLLTVDKYGMTINLNYAFMTLFVPGESDALFKGGSAEFPIWIGRPIDGGNKIFIAKSNLFITKTDVLFFTVMAVCLIVLFFVILMILVIKIITGISNQKKLKAIFFNDEVTGGYNWTYFRVKGEQILKKGSNAKNRFAVLDVVFVKYRNYCVCHSVEEGEKKLNAVDQVLRYFVGKNEVCGHYASANFAVMVRADNEEVLRNRLNDLMNRLTSIDRVHRIAFHIGVAYVDPDTDKNGNFIKRRDIFLENDYNNACAARATIDDSDDSGIAYFDDKLVEEQKWIDSVQERQASALANEEFMVYYQPKYNPQSETLTGAEALIRWQSPEFGFISPGRFIPIFEKNGFITEIDHYMIRHVARDQKRWYDEGLSCVPVSVNVSRAHFIEDDLAEQIRDIVDEEGAPHNLIEIELTESAFFDDKKALVNTINRLKEYGFAVSMDDFGSGYSSLNSLKDLPLDVLKLDAEFFRGNADEGRQEAVISETIRLAKALNMRTVAEGVEVREQVDFLAKQGCDMIQGYIFDKPITKDEFVQRMNGIGTPS